jgi:hypothetical protein
MASGNQALWERQLNSEERQYLRDLQVHPGFSLLAQALGELMQQDLQAFLSSRDTWEIANMQGKYLRGQEVLGIPSKLLQVNSPLARR